MQSVSFFCCCTYSISTDQAKCTFCAPLSLPTRLDAAPKQSLMEKPPTTAACWACEYSDLTDQARCTICSPPITKKCTITKPQNLYVLRYVPSVSASILSKLYKKYERNQKGLEAAVYDIIAMSEDSTVEKDVDKPLQHNISTITLLHPCPTENVPGITLTGPSKDSSTMSLATWENMNIWPIVDSADLRISFTPPRQHKRKRHSRRCPCERCERAAVSNLQYKRAMTDTEIVEEMDWFDYYVDEAGKVDAEREVDDEREQIGRTHFPKEIEELIKYYADETKNVDVIVKSYREKKSIANTTGAAGVQRSSM